MSIEDLRAQIRDFVDARDWSQFHTPRSLLLALTGEVGELSEIFQWTNDSAMTTEWIEEHREDFSDELADVFIYLIRLSDVLDVDLTQAAVDKIKRNEERYPAKLARGNAKKYTQLGD